MFIKKFAPWILFILVFLLLYLTSSPSIGWWNSGGEVACAYSLGIPDPGGSILYVLIGKAFVLLFFFLHAVKAITLVSIVSTSLSAVFLYYSLLITFENLPFQIPEEVKLISSFFTSLSLPFLYSIWIESTTPQVYVLGLFLTSILVYCSIKIWFSNDEKEKTNLIFLISFLIGLDFAAHRLNTPFIPIIILLLAFPLKKHLVNVRFWLILIVMYLAGFSFNLYLLIRSPMHPAFAMDDVQNLSQLYAWIDMKRFGESNFSNIFNRKGPFWGYQVNHMYMRYLGWNFWGMQGEGTVFNQFYLSFIPLVLGIIGFLIILIRKFKLWVLLFVTFLFFSFGLVLYSNIREGFDLVREIDRLFIPSFYVFMIFTGTGLYYIVTLIYDFSTKRKLAKAKIIIAISVLSFIILPLNIILTNWFKCDRSGYYFPEDFAYNLLTGCEQNGILFTNGDNDTYPLWYLQDVEGFRRDVAVINLSLLNTDYYIAELQRKYKLFPKDSEVLIPDKFAPSLIDSSISIDIVGNDSIELRNNRDSLTIKYNGRNFGKRHGLMPQDKALISLLEKNGWRRPVYFAVTVDQDNMVGLAEYLGTAGMIQELLPVKGDSLLPKQLNDNLVNKYRFRNFNNPNVYADILSTRMFSNYSFLFLKLSQYYLNKDDNVKARGIFEKMELRLPYWRFPEEQNKAVLQFKKELK
jgi:Protein O-mannosyl-transferase TMEM260-like